MMKNKATVLTSIIFILFGQYLFGQFYYGHVLFGDQEIDLTAIKTNSSIIVQIELDGEVIKNQIVITNIH
ncbi:MAG: hypothetical protein DHS20C18_54680 [Saprospiraceae bacterium]|nr:MAG: hypothetical protein DHS20C18_54680 [Saprospiraceae bacterium]